MFTYVSPSATIGLCVVVVALILAPVSKVYKIMFILPHVALDSSMACRVFRGLKLGLIQDIEELSVQSNSLRFAQNPNLTTGVPSDIHNLGPCDLKDSRHDIVVHLEANPKEEPSSYEHDDGRSDGKGSEVPSRWV